MISWKLSCCILFISASIRTTVPDEVTEEADIFMKEMEESEHSDPKTASSLAYETLKKTFEKTNPSGLSMMQVLEKLENFKGPAKYYGLRMFEAMDDNFDGQISAAEMAFTYMEPVSSEPELMKFLFRVKDLDNNGYITPWEIVREKMILEGNILPISTLWKTAIDIIKTDDLDNDGVLDPQEYMLGKAMNIDISIVKAKRKWEAMNSDKNGVKQRKFTPQQPTPRKAHAKIKMPM